MNKLIKILFITSLFFLQACATGSSKEKIYRNMAIATLVGLAAAQQKEKNKFGYAVAFGGGMAALAGVGSMEYYDIDKDLREAKAKLKFIDDMELQRSKNISEELPEDLKSLVNSHHYDVYKMNRWTQRGPKLLVKESEAIELKEVKTNEE